MNNICHKVEESRCLPPNCKYINGPKLKYCRKVSSVKTKNPSSVKTKNPSSVKTKKRSSVGTTLKCKKLSQADCLPPDCKYINGPKLKYCKRATTAKRTSKIKTPPTNHATTPKRTSKIKTPPTNIVNSIIPFLQKNISLWWPSQTAKALTPLTMSLIPVAKSLTPPPKKDNTKMAAQKIQAFIHKKRGNITAFFLNSVCQDSGTCFAFGKESTKIKSFFDNFSNFKYALNHQQISRGANGDIYEIEYDRLNYKSFAILKIATKKTADNLVYEYFVGLFINSMYKKTPSLLETYGLYKMPTNNLGGLNDLTLVNTKSQQEIESTISLACLQPTNFGILIEHLKGSVPLTKMLNYFNFVKYDLIYSVFHVYFTLCMMKDVFTHYDLHGENVLVYMPVPDKYIQYHYHFTPSLTISFKSPYIVKIIDYGRSYFNNATQNIDSEFIRKMICQRPDCNIPPSKCGEDSGFDWLNTKSRATYYYINSSAINRSHDLRLINTLIKSLKIRVKNPAIHNVIKTNSDIDADTNKNISYFFNKRNLKYDKEYGTPEMLTSGLPKKMHNIMDVLRVLQEICFNTSFITQNNNCYDIGGARYGFGKIGDLHIYADNRDMEFVAV